MLNVTVGLWALPGKETESRMVTTPCLEKSSQFLPWQQVRLVSPVSTQVQSEGLLPARKVSSLELLFVCLFLRMRYNINRNRNSRTSAYTPVNSLGASRGTLCIL